MPFEVKKPLDKQRPWSAILSFVAIFVLFGGLLTSTQWKPTSPNTFRGIATVEASGAQKSNTPSLRTIRNNPREVPLSEATRALYLRNRSIQ